MPVKRTVLYTEQTPYGSYKVVDTLYNERPARVLYGDGRSPQSGVAKDDNPELLFNYNQRFLEMLMSVRPKKVLVIGGGAFMLPIAAFHQFPDMSLDVVEIDGALVRISRDYFDLPDDERLQVYVGDGADFLAHSKTRYDMIILDAFSGFNIPRHLLESVTITQYKRHLKRKGVIAINFISEYKPHRYDLAHELIDRFGAVFAYVSMYQADAEYPRGDEQNLLLVASQKATTFDYLHSVEIDLLESGNKS